MAEATSQIRILLIEDNESFRASLAQLLRYEGYDVEEAGNGKEGLLKARNRKPHAIVCDLLMPEMDGYSFIDTLRSDPATARIPVLILTANGSDQEIFKGLSHAEEYMCKPVNSTELVARLDSLIRNNELRERIRSLTQNLEIQVRERTAQLQKVNSDLAKEMDRRMVSENEVTRLSQSLLEIQEKERATIAADLHDDIGQRLVSLKWKLQNTFAACAKLQGEGFTSQILDQLDEISEGIRAVTKKLTPEHYRVLGIESALEKLADEMHVFFDSVSLDLADLSGFFPENWNVNFYRIVQEALANAAKHSKATGVTIKTERTNSQTLRLTIHDNGIGIRPGAERGIGILTMEQRTRSLYGSFTMRSESDRGTEITIELPEP